jgi:hypothetical protein
LGREDNMAEKPIIVEAAGYATMTISIQAVGTGVIGGWITESEDDILILKEIESQTDRAAALKAMLHAASLPVALAPEVEVALAPYRIRRAET